MSETFSLNSCTELNAEKLAVFLVFLTKGAHWTNPLLEIKLNFKQSNRWTCIDIILGAGKITFPKGILDKKKQDTPKILRLV